MASLSEAGPALALERRWLSLAERLGVDDELAAQWWGTLFARYSEDHRAYHTHAHLDSMFQLFDEFESELQDGDAVSLAVFFHDIVYDPTRGDNEERSADIFQQFASESLGIVKEDAGQASGGVCTLTEARAQAVHGMIILTKNHATEAHQIPGQVGAGDEHFLLDFDMAVLGWERQEYRRYGREVRREYQHIPWAAYKEGRPRVLKGFLDQASIFATQPLRQRLEAQARHNLRLEIQELQGSESEDVWVGDRSV